MSNEPTITLTGNLTEDPELRFVASGDAVCKFRIAQTPRLMDRSSGQWKDGDPIYLSCTAWRQMAENVAESLTRGMRVIVEGRLRMRTYETREGEKRTVFEVEVDEVGPSLRYAAAKVAKNAKGGGNASQPRGDDWGAASATRPAANAEQQRAAQQRQPAAASPADDW